MIIISDAVQFVCMYLIIQSTMVSTKNWVYHNEVIIFTGGRKVVDF